MNFDPESYNNKTTQDWETLVFQRNTWRDVERTNPTSAPQDDNFGYVTLVTGECFLNKLEKVEIPDVL